MVQWFVAVAHVPLVALCPLDVGDPTCPLDAERVAGLSVDEVLRDVGGVELLSLELRSVVVQVVCRLRILVVVNELAAGLVPDGLVEGILYRWRRWQLAS